MATVQETQDYLDEAKTPSTGTPAQAQAAIRAFIAPGSKMMRQAVLWRELLETSELVEPDEILLGKYEECRQKFMAMERIMTDVRGKMTDLVGAYRQWQELDAEMRTIAQGLGYTV